MKKQAILTLIPFTADSLSQVEYLQHKGDQSPSVFKKGDIILVEQWLRDHESKEKHWKEWWQPIKFLLMCENKFIGLNRQIKFDEGRAIILKNEGKCWVEWEENQCDGCKARIPFNGHNNHQKPNDPTDPFGMGCTAHLYDKPKLTDSKITLYL